MSSFSQPKFTQWQPQLIAKYDVAGPRYTSYPTALQFTESFTEQDYRAELAPSQASIAPLSLYFHIPFCHNVCYFCACNKMVTKKHELAREYLDYLQREIALQAQLIPKSRPVTQLHWGGGTPTFLSLAEITELMFSISSHFNLTDDDSREYSIEIDPRTIDVQTLALLKGLGFNRISLGVQDFSPQVQQAVNRIQPYEQVAELVKAVRDFGFKSLNFDLIYGLPHQTSETLTETIDQVIGLSPDRISFYNYAHLPERFPPQRAIDRLTLPTPQQKLDMIETIGEHLQNGGYRYIGMDHFVKPEDDLAIAQENEHLQRNFQGYSVNKAQDLIGMGCSSISAIGNSYSQNSRDIQDYYQRIDAGQLPIEKGLTLTQDDIIRRAVIQQVICHCHLDFAAIDSQFQIQFETYFADALDKLKPMIDDQLVTIDQRELRVSSMGQTLLRNVCMAFDAYLCATKQQQQPRFSKAI